jgi:hypothetical protein
MWHEMCPVCKKMTLWKHLYPGPWGNKLKYCRECGTVRIAEE